MEIFVESIADFKQTRRLGLCKTVQAEVIKP